MCAVQVGQSMQAEQLLRSLNRVGGDLPGELQLLQLLQLMQLGHCSKFSATRLGKDHAESSKALALQSPGANDGSGGHCTGKMSRPTYRFISEVAQSFTPSVPQKLPQSSYLRSA